MTKYTTYGDVRGGCGHRHSTREAAERCLSRDQRGCKCQGGYSDRSVVYVDDDGVLYYDEEMTDWVPGIGGGAAAATI